MKSEEMIKAMLEKAEKELEENCNSYTEGVREALQWVLYNDYDPPIMD
jgi:hypothetical protein